MDYNVTFLGMRNCHDIYCSKMPYCLENTAREMPNSLANTARDARFSKKYSSGNTKFLGMPNSLGHTVRGCKSSRRDTKFPSEYGLGMANFL